MIYVADIEATTDPENCYVWAWGLMEIETEEYVTGCTLDELCETLIGLEKGVVFFHNMKYDGTFILYWLLSHNWIHIYEGSKKKKKLSVHEFKTVISDDSKFYDITLQTGSGLLHIRDSLKNIPIPIKAFHKAFGVEEKKGEIDYSKERPLPYFPTKEEWEYLYHDVHLLKVGIKTLFDQGLTKMTVGANALGWYKSELGEDKFKYLFPLLAPEIDKEIRKAYKGGYCYCNPKFQNKLVGRGLVADRNSMYPAEMKSKAYPVGEPIYYEGGYEKDENYPLYIQRIKCRFKVKKNHLPTIQLKHSIFIETAYLESSVGPDGIDEPVVLTLTSVDLKLFLRHYDVYDYEEIDGFKFLAACNIFTFYVDFWYKQKEVAEKTGNKGLRQIAKLMLNNLYGKFGKRGTVGRKVPYIEDGTIKYLTMESEETDTVYVPVACFVTAYARENVITLGQLNFDKLCYIDTDSLHVLGEEIKGIEIDEFKLGAWKIESKFFKAKFIRAKCYLELFHVKLKVKKYFYSKFYFEFKIQRKVKVCFIPFNNRVYRHFNVKCAGMPASCHRYVNFDNFKVGSVFEGKLQAKNVAGGQVLINVPFTIKA